MKKAKKTYKNSFSEGGHPKMKNKKTIFLQKLPDTICVRKGEQKRAFSCTLSALAKNIFGPKQCKAGKTMKIVVSAEIAQNQK